MALRISRGLFRFWIVLSVLWIGGVGTITWPWGWQGAPIGHEVDRLDPQATKIIEVQTPDGMIHQFPAGTASDVIDRTMRDYWRGHETKTAAEMALIPPALVLVLGSALGWAFKGFR